MSLVKRHASIVKHLGEDFFEAFNYESQAVLGYGGFAKVILAESKNNRNIKRAVKKFPVKNINDSDEDECQNENLERLFMKEVGIMSRLNHPHLMKILYAVQCPLYFAILMPYCEGGTLGCNLPTLDKDHMRRYAKQTAQAVKYMHDNKIYHGDIKPSNVLIKDGSVILGDFGLSRQVPNHDVKVFIESGTEDFRAPETYDGFRIDPFKADVYSLGVTLWCIVMKRLPHSSDSLSDDLDGCKENKAVPRGYRCIIKSMIYHLPCMRPSVADVVPDL